MFVGTGVGHSGTGWFSAFMTELGYPCGHEKLYNPTSQGPLSAPESSWLLIPYLDSVPEDVPIVHLVRDPLKIINSMLRTDDLRRDSDPYARYIKQHLPEVFGFTSQVQRIMAHVAWWSIPVENRDNMLVRVGEEYEEVADNHDPGYLREVALYCTGDRPSLGDVTAAIRKVGRVNDHKRRLKDRVAWDGLPDQDLKRELVGFADFYGFTDSRE